MRSIIVLALLLCACSAPTTTNISIIEDRTDPHKVVLDSAIYNLFDLDQPQNGVHLRYQELYDVDIHHVHEFHLDGEYELLSNANVRQKQIEAFKADVGSLLRSDTSQFEHSSIWIPLMRELETLSKGEDEYDIYVLSDMKEHSDWMNLYQMEDVLRSRPERVREQFRTRIPVFERTDHLSLTIVYQAHDLSESASFRLLMDSLYLPLFNEAGIQTSIKGNL